jgi:hypothetical protein
MAGDDLSLVIDASAWSERAKSRRSSTHPPERTRRVLDIARRASIQQEKRNKAQKRCQKKPCEKVRSFHFSLPWLSGDD